MYISRKLQVMCCFLVDPFYIPGANAQYQCSSLFQYIYMIIDHNWFHEYSDSKSMGVQFNEPELIVELSPEFNVQPMAMDTIIYMKIKSPL